MTVFFWRTPIKINPHDEEGFINFQPALTNESAWKGRGAEYMVIGGLLGQCAHCALEKKERRLCDNKSLRLHLNARDFSQHKSKMSAGRVGGCVAPGRSVFGAKNCPFFSPPGSRPTLTTSLKDNKVSLTKKITFVVSNIKKMY